MLNMRDNALCNHGNHIKWFFFLQYGAFQSFGYTNQDVTGINVVWPFLSFYFIQDHSAVIN